MDINLLPLFSDTDSEDEEEIAEKDAARAFEKGAKKIAGKCTAYGYSKEKAEKSAKLERKTAEFQSKYFKKLILYRFLQSMTTGTYDGDGQLSEETRAMLSNLLTASEWKAIATISPSKIPHQFDLNPDDKPPHDFDEVIAKCLTSKVENMVSTLTSLSGGIDKEGPEKTKALRDEMFSLERTRCRRMFETQAKLFHYLRKLAEKIGKEQCLSGNLLDEESESVDFLLEKADALAQKAKILNLEILCAKYTKKRVEELESKRMEQLNLREELEAQIEETRAQLEAFVNVAGHDYNQVVKEYRDTKDQIEQCNWALKEISSPTSPLP